MIRVACFVLCVAFLLGVGAPAEAKKEDKPLIKVVTEQLDSGAEFELKLTAPDTGEKFELSREAAYFDRVAFQTCFSADGKGAFTAAVRFPKDGDTYTLRSIGPAEDLYVAHIYDLKTKLPKWYKKATDALKDSPDVTVGKPKLGKAKEVEQIPRFLLNAIALATTKYEEKRAELYLRVRKDSHLFCASAGQMYWSLLRDGDRLFVHAWRVDKLYVMTFYVELKRKPGGGEAEWEYVRTYGEEEWKGE